MLLSAPRWSCPKRAVMGARALGRPAGSGDGCEVRCRCPSLHPNTQTDLCRHGAWHRAGQEPAATQRATSLLFRMPLFRRGISQSNPKAPVPKFWGQRARQEGSARQPHASPGTGWAATISMMGTVPGKWVPSCPQHPGHRGQRRPGSREEAGEPRNTLRRQTKAWLGCAGRVWLCRRALGKRDGEGAERHPLLQEQGLSLHPPG